MDVRKKLSRRIGYLERRIVEIRTHYTKRPERERGKRWRSSMGHRQRQYRAALEQTYDTLNGVKEITPDIPENQDLRNWISETLIRLQPHIDQKRRGDRIRKRQGNGKQH